MSKAVDLLLNKSNNDAQVEIERLSDQIGQPFFITIRPIDLFSIEATTEEDAIFQTLKLGIVDDFNNEELFIEDIDIDIKTISTFYISFSSLNLV